MGRWLRGAIAAAVVGTLFVSGCAGQTKPMAVPAAAQRQVNVKGSSLDAIARRGELRIAVDHSSAPFSAWTKNSMSEFEGFAVDVGRRMTQIIFGGKTTTTFKPALSDPQSAMEQGLFDVLMEPWVIPFAKEEKLHLSPPYFSNSMQFLVRKDRVVARIQDLSGTQVGSFSGTPNFDYKDLSAHLTQQKQQPVALTYKELRSADEAVTALTEGQVAAVSGRTSQLAPFLKADSRLVLLPERWQIVPCSVAVLKQYADLAGAVDKAIQQMNESGEIAKLAAKWGLEI